MIEGHHPPNFPLNMENMREICCEQVTGGLQEFCIVINLQGIETTMTLEIQQFRQITSKIQPRGTWKIRSFLRISISTFLKIPGMSS